jgi:GTP-binding protein HflX
LIRTTQNQVKERAFLVGVVMPGMRRHQTLEHLDELALLADTAGAEVVGRETQEIHAVNPAFLIGKGKVGQIAHMVEDLGATIVLFDEDLTPVQTKNLEKEIKKRIVDRSGLILDIFARRARTREAQTQVALAQLEYLLPRLTRQWTHLERQEGAIGTRGPGETQLETDRRLIRKRIGLLKEELKRIELQRGVRRRHREPFQKVALVGYTNAGKSSLLNALAGADAFVENRLFATLDATIRTFHLTHHERVMLIDTVGFIRKLPPHLVASFRSTLEETVEADLLLHVVDVNHPNFEDHIGTVHQVLRDLGAEGKPVIMVFNKIDLLIDRQTIERLKSEFPDSVFVSALRGLGLETLRQAVAERFESQKETFELRIPIHRSDWIASIHELAEILDKRYEDDAVLLSCKAYKPNAARIRELISEGATPCAF